MVHAVAPLNVPSEKNGQVTGQQYEGITLFTDRA